MRRTPWNQTVTDLIPTTAICCVAAGPGLRTQPLPAILFWASVNINAKKKSENLKQEEDTNLDIKDWIALD